jgi:mono/diheme cytochrome c family protein
MHNHAQRCTILAALTAYVLAAQTPQPTDFTHDIQPIFAKSCEGCHGAKLQLGGLRLDARDAALAGGQSGKVIEPGSAEKSNLYTRITGKGEQARMPMGAKPLPPAQLETIRLWLEQGANWPRSASTSVTIPARKHWAFIPPVRPATPTVHNTAWPRTPIDSFILAKLESESLAPSPEANKYTLLRRLSLDLTGLPPSPEETRAFLADLSPKAYAKQVDRLLASPHYGERWARVWLDGARYADSDGFEKDKAREAWFYRDWVINALNRDLPYNQFITEQIAGDLLPNPTQDQLVATGFLRNSMINEEGGADPEQFRMEAMFDRMEAVGKGILGVTIQCAQCHNHKFDPLKQEEYYRMFAFLNDTHEARTAVYTPAQQMKRAEIFRGTKEIEDSLQHSYPDWPQRMATWEQQFAAPQPTWEVLKPAIDDTSAGGEKFSFKPDGSLLGEGFIASQQKLKLTAKSTLPRITAFRLELLNDADLPLTGPGRGPDGMCALTEFKVTIPATKQDLKFSTATADFGMAPTPLPARYNNASVKISRELGPISFAIDGKPETAWGIDMSPGLRNQPHNAVFTLETPLEATSEFTITLEQSHSAQADSPYNTNLGRFRLSVTGDPAAADPLPPAVRTILSIPTAQRTASQTRTVFRYFRTTVPEWQPANTQIAELWNQHPQGFSQLVLQPLETPRETHLLSRGSFLTPANIVQPGVPAFLNPLPPDAKPNRLSFARWMVDRQSPTTARSLVNRLWQSYFGTGIVSTSENFGTQAETPSHPELLDWLAVDFMESNWSMKKLHRTIVMSAAYRQSSRVTPDLLARDPDNRLLARGPRFRVDAESVRDIALAASGLLNEKVGGPSVYPPAPAFLFLPPTSYSPKSWPESQGADRYRRALYTFRYRSVPYPVLQAFDAPNGDVSCVRRDRSNTPLQALATLNETMFLETARALAVKTLQSGGTADESRIRYAFERCVSRPPDTKETAVLLKLLQTQSARFTSKDENALELTGSLPSGIAPAQAAAWTVVSRVLLNLDETITKE